MKGLTSSSVEHSSLFIGVLPWSVLLEQEMDPPVSILPDKKLFKCLRLLRCESRVVSVVPSRGRVE